MTICVSSFQLNASFDGVSLNSHGNSSSLSSKASSALAKLFKKDSSDSTQLQNLINIRQTDKTRSFRKPSKPEVEPTPSINPQPKPLVLEPAGNETIVDGEILDEGEMSVVVMPPTPIKPPPASTMTSTSP